MNESHNEPERLIQNLLYFTALVFIMSGVYGIVSPNSIATLMNVDGMTAKIFSGAIILAGIADLILAKTIFNVRDRK